jgi:hypothetical protein
VFIRKIRVPNHPQPCNTPRISPPNRSILHGVSFNTIANSSPLRGFPSARLNSRSRGSTTSDPTRISLAVFFRHTRSASNRASKRSSGFAWRGG